MQHMYNFLEKIKLKDVISNSFGKLLDNLSPKCTNPPFLVLTKFFKLVRIFEENLVYFFIENEKALLFSLCG